MLNVNALIPRLIEQDVRVCWTEELGRAGLWVKSHRLLLLDAGATTLTTAGVCAEMLARLNPDLLLPL